MKLVKKVSVSGEFAKKGEDIMNGDVVTILNSGTVTEGQYGEQYVFEIETRNGKKNTNFNQSSLNILIEEYGGDTEGWVGKEVTIRAKKDVVAGRKVDIYYFCTPAWDFDEYRELVKTETQAAEEEVPSVDVDEDISGPF